jgi:hypothetical protein
MENRTYKMSLNHGWNIFKSNFFLFFPNLKISKNKFSLVIIFIYILLLFSMSYNSSASILEEISISLFPILVFVSWSNLFVKERRKKTQVLTRKVLFHQDFFLIFYAFYVGCLVHIISEFNNVDVRGWWPLAILFLFAYGFLFSLFYSLIGMLIKKSCLYRISFPVGIFVLMATLKIWPLYPNINFLNLKSPFEIILATSLIIHSCYCFTMFFVHKYRSSDGND